MAQRISTYVNDAARQRFERIHRVALAALPDHRVEHVRTDFGTVQALTLGAASGTPVVLLHGMSCTSAMWAPNLPALARHHHLIALDAIVDCGGSHQTVPVIDRADQVRNVAQALDGLGVRRAHFVGLSYGAWIAAACAVEKPEMVASLSLLEPAGTLHGIGLAYLRGFLASFLRKSPHRWDFLFHRRPSDELIGLLDAAGGSGPGRRCPARSPTPSSRGSRSPSRWSSATGAPPATSRRPVRGCR